MLRPGFIVVLLIPLCGGCGREAPSIPAEVPAATYVGRASCVECHPENGLKHADSHHDLAMDEALPETVLGDFSRPEETGMSRRGDSFFAATDLGEKEISHVFGVTPLQQYLAPTEGGRLQVLPQCWDTLEERWFRLHPEEEVPPGDELHWAGRNQTWNYMCAECHSTNLVKNYVTAADMYATSWSEIDVSCEACHGPGSNHSDYALGLLPGVPDKGFVFRLRDHSEGVWRFPEGEVTARRSVAREAPDRQVDTCARCHSRRSPIKEEYTHGGALSQTHRLALLDERLYHPDGQIQDEVYVHGSFLQSRMYAEGVVCSDCHDQHSLQLRAPCNLVCASCHLPTAFDAPDHHHHTEPILCVDCHMPETTYMEVDPRRDHSIRVPRPDLSQKLGSPNACNMCHADRDVAWAAEAFREWYPGERPAHYGEALAAGRNDAPDAARQLTAVAQDPDVPAIARATALTLLGRRLDGEVVKVILACMDDESELVRAAVATSLRDADAGSQQRAGLALLRDAVLGVRIAAVSLLADAPGSAVPAAARQEYIDSELVNAERPGAHVNLGLFYSRRGRWLEAEAAYQKALELEPASIRALINLADVYRATSRDPEGEVLLRKALELRPQDASVAHALGLLLARRERMEEAMEYLRRAAVLDRDSARFAYVYGVALDSMGRREEALIDLERTHQLHPRDRDVLLALATMNRDAGRIGPAIAFARKLTSLEPDNPGFRALLGQLEQH